MLCSAPAQKSGLNWLDRLRFSKGIPTGDHLDLDSFLSSHPNPNNHKPSLSFPLKNQIRSSDVSAGDVLRPFGSVLADLFNVGGRLSYGKKCPRKQTNPKFFFTSCSSSLSKRKDENAPAEGLDYADVEEEEEKENDLSGFSKSEVTVIDTSCSEWKAHKFVFRKNYVWKVRERKGKSMSFLKNKNKGFVHHNRAGVNKVAKVMEYQFGSIREDSL